MWTKIRHIKRTNDALPNEEYFTLDNIKVSFSGNVFFKADIEKFQYQFGFGKDDKKCYGNGSFYRGADPETFEVLNAHFAKDKSHIYTIGGIEKKVDYETFEVLDNGYYIEEETGRKRRTFSYSKDKNGIWWMAYYSIKATQIRGADIESFTILNESYTKDKNHVYHQGKRIKKADLDSFRPISKVYAIDKNTAYFLDNAIENSHVETFETFNKHQPNFARDKKRFYEKATEITEREFLEIQRKSVDLEVRQATREEREKEQQEKLDEYRAKRAMLKPK